MPDLLDRVRRSFTERSRVTREAFILGLALIAGLVLVPLAIWFVGDRLLGPYVHGSNPHAGPLPLLGDFFAGLGHGAITFWIVAIGPACFILFARGVFALLRPRPEPKSATPLPDEVLPR